MTWRPTCVEHTHPFWNFLWGNQGRACCTCSILLQNFPLLKLHHEVTPGDISAVLGKENQLDTVLILPFPLYETPTRHFTIQLCSEMQIFGCTAKQHGRHEAPSIKPSHNTSHLRIMMDLWGGEKENHRNKQKHLNKGIAEDKSCACQILHVAITFCLSNEFLEYLQ